MLPLNIPKPITRDEKRTLLPARLLDLARHAVPHQPVVGLKLLHRLGGVVDESKTGALAATIVRLETEDGDIFLLGLVQLAELATEFVLGDVGAVGVEDVAANCPSDQCPLYSSMTTRPCCACTYSTIWRRPRSGLRMNLRVRKVTWSAMLEDYFVDLGVGTVSIGMSCVQ
jgi:hypothetical protein